jgi:hypothetical protein
MKKECIHARHNTKYYSLLEDDFQDCFEIELCTVQFFVKKKLADLRFFRINRKNLRVCDLRTGTPKKFLDLR